MRSTQAQTWPMTGSSTTKARFTLAALGATLALSLAASAAMLAPLARAAGQNEAAEERLSVEYDGQRYFLTRQLSSEELQDLLAGNTLVFLHPGGEEQELHLEDGRTLNGWSITENADTGFWQIEGDEVCWTYSSGTHCKPLFASEMENLYAQVPGWHDGPLAFIWEPGDSRGLGARPLNGDAI